MQCNYNETVAVKHGINSALILYHIQSELDAARVTYCHKAPWVRLPCKMITGVYPFMGIYSARTAAKRLVRDNIITAKKLRKTKFDHAYFYTITDYGYAVLKGDEPIE